MADDLLRQILLLLQGVARHHRRRPILPSRAPPAERGAPPAHRSAALPWSPNGVGGASAFQCRHQAFGLGRSGAYKVARFFFRSGVNDVGIEVFTIGRRHQQWRETAAPPPYPIRAGRTATFFKGSLLWTIDESLREGKPPAMPSFVRFSLDDESFPVMPAPPAFPGVDPDPLQDSSLAELQGELCLARGGRPSDRIGGRSVDMWYYADMDRPRWVRRYVLDVCRPIDLVTAFDHGVVFTAFHYLCHYCLDQTQLHGVLELNRFRYPHRNLSGALVEYTGEPYVAFV